MASERWGPEMGLIDIPLGLRRRKVGEKFSPFSVWAMRVDFVSVHRGRGHDKGMKCER